MSREAPRFLLAPDGFSSLLAKRYAETGVEVLVPPGVGWGSLEPGWTWTLARWTHRHRFAEHQPDHPGAQSIALLDILRRGRQWFRRSPRQRPALVWILEQSVYYTVQLLEADPMSSGDAIDRGLDLLGELRDIAARPQPHPELIGEALRDMPDLSVFAMLAAGEPSNIEVP
jgi:hypothetical protein